MATDKLPQIARLIWDEQGLPLSEHYGDYYFSKKNGLEESRYVYLQQNHLTERFQGLANGDNFVVGEIGFGSGLNFLVTWQLWQQLAPAEAKLHFISVEKFPLATADLERALNLWPELHSLALPLQQQYPAILHHGFHRLTLDQGRVELTLIIDEAHSGLQQLLETTHPAFCKARRPVDAWFLDGFSPPKNPDLWQDKLFQLIKQLSRKGTTLATFTAASLVNRSLKASSFSTEKVKGFGLKREMLRADLLDNAPLPPASDFTNSRSKADDPAPWMAHPVVPKRSRRAVVVGAGLAGCHTALALAQRGWQVSVLEQHQHLAAEGSGNPQGVLYAKLSHRAETLSNFNLLALQYGQRFYQPYWHAQPGPRRSQAVAAIGAQCGVLQLAYNEKVEQQQSRLSQHFNEQQLFVKIDKHQASTISGIEQSFGGIYFPGSGWINPAALCQQLVAHPNINVCTGISLTQLQPSDTQGWTLHTRQAGSEQIINADTVILCTASAIKQFPQTAQLPVKPIRGQVSNLRATPLSRQLKTVVCGDGYISPANGDLHCLGATFNHRDNNPEVRPQDHTENLDKLRLQIPILDNSLIEENIETGRVGFRCTTPDYLPIVGAAPDYSAYIQTFAPMRKDARASIPSLGPVLNNLYINLGHGSRGLAYTPICAEILAAQINHEPSPVGYTIETALHPARFWIRALRRGTL